MKTFFKNLITSGIKGETFSEDVRKAMIINSFSFVGMLSLITFAINGILTSQIFYTATVLIF